MQHFLLSSKAKTLRLADVLRMTDQEAETAFRKFRWQDTSGEPVCPSCGGLDAYDCRRPKGAPEEMIYRVGDLSLDRLSHKVTRAGEEIVLQPREYRLLEYLMQNAGKVVTRTMLLEHVWDYHFDPQTNVIDVHVSRLRSKIDRDFETPLLHTVRGAGYMIRDGAR